ncbi:LamG-like jellyroll fold domain-containing protein, partial [Thermoplasmatota archaeon]
WSDHYMMVQHLNETSGIHYDSTSYDNDGSPMNGVNQSGVGLIDGCDTFDATDDYVDCGYDSGLEPGTGDYTIETWIKRLDFGTHHSIFSKRTGTGDGYAFWIEDEDLLRFFAIPIGDSIDMQSGPITDNYWHYAVVTLDRDGNATLYLDGSLSMTTNISTKTGAITSSQLFAFGAQYTTGVQQPMNGSLDEIRLSDVARSPGWIATNYNNQDDPDSFFDVGYEETVPSDDVVPPVISDVDITISAPIDTDPSYGWENISCTVIDDMGVHSVYLNITYPDLHTENISMTDSGGGQYYYNTTYTEIGSYGYFIWANDASDNTNASSSNIFVIPPNWDINNDHDCSIFDLVLVAGHFDETGYNGWIREDVNNDGDVSIVDLVLVAGHFDETW